MTLKSNLKYEMVDGEMSNAKVMQYLLSDIISLALKWNSELGLNFI